MLDPASSQLEPELTLLNLDAVSLLRAQILPEMSQKSSIVRVELAANQLWPSVVCVISIIVLLVYLRV